MNAKFSVFVIYVEPIIYLLLHNLQDCTFGNSNLKTAWETAAKMNNTYYESQGSHKSATSVTSHSFRLVKDKSVADQEFWKIFSKVRDIPHFV